MPSIPLVPPTIPSQSGGAPGGISPVLRSAPSISPVRANPGMNDAKYQAQQRLASAAGEALSPLVQVQMQVKQASDAGYITSAQTQMAAANLDFQRWTKENPDPQTWGSELNGRMADTKARIEEGAKTLSPAAKARLQLTIGAWEIGTQREVALQATTKSLEIAAASFNDYIQVATANNDLEAVQAKLAEGVEQGIYNAKTAQSIGARAAQQITMNRANLMIEADPFEAERRLGAQEEGTGAYKELPEMNATMRQTLIFRAHRAAVQQRQNIVKEWSQMIRDAQEKGGPMPDRAGIEEEARHIGVTPKQVDALFRTPQATDPKEFAATFGAISSYEPTQDPTGERMGELVVQIEGFKGPARERLDALLTKKQKPDDPINRPAAKAFFTRAEEQHDAGMFLPGSVVKEKIPGTGFLGTSLGAKTKDVVKPPTPEERRAWKANLPKEVLDAEAIRYTDYLTKMRAYFDKNPDATDVDAETYARELRKPYVMENVATAIQKSATEDNPVKGERRRQKGIIYEWTGRSWKPVP